MGCLHFETIRSHFRRVDLFVERDGNMHIFFAAGGSRSK